MHRGRFTFMAVIALGGMELAPVKKNQVQGIFDIGAFGSMTPIRVKYLKLLILSKNFIFPPVQW